MIKAIRQKQSKNSKQSKNNKIAKAINNAVKRIPPFFFWGGVSSKPCLYSAVAFDSLTGNECNVHFLKIGVEDNPLYFDRVTFNRHVL